VDRKRRIRPSGDIAASDWVAERIASYEAWTVGSIVPTGFEAYARIFHPAEGPFGTRARWADVATWSGTVMHPHAEFERIQQGTSGEQSTYTPDPGELAPDLVSALAVVLRRHTDSPNRCWFCVWEGGWITGPGAILTATNAPSSVRAEAQREWEAAWQPFFGDHAIEGQRVRLPGRNYHLFKGPLDAIHEIGEQRHWRDASHFDPHSPNLWWPDDHTWCVATDIDLDSTYIGGEIALIDELLADPSFEALAVNASDVRGDRINTAS